MSQVLERMNLKMRQRILKAATTLFVRKGFSGVSLGDVAKKLRINQSLIYHYFASKEDLWNAVKKPFMEHYLLDSPEMALASCPGLRALLDTYLSSAVDYWFHHAATARFLRWNSLHEKEPLPLASDSLCQTIERLQKQGMITTSILPSIAAALMRNAARGPFFCVAKVLLRTAPERIAYRAVIIDCLERLLHP
jgi:AcrR family transcriptional regulator